MSLSKFKEKTAPFAAQLSKIYNEMTEYYEKRSENWQDSESGLAFSDCLDCLDEAIMQLDDLQDKLEEQILLGLG